MSQFTKQRKVRRKRQQIEGERFKEGISKFRNKLHEAAKEIKKGIKGGNCNVTACQKPNAVYFNKSTKKYYCEHCAELINWESGRADVMQLYGTPLLCEKD